MTRLFMNKKEIMETLEEETDGVFEFSESSDESEDIDMNSADNDRDQNEELSSDSSFESDVSSSHDEIEHATDLSLKAKNGIQWNQNPPPPSCTRLDNIIRTRSGPPRFVVATTSLKCAFDFFISRSRLDEIIL